MLLASFGGGSVGTCIGGVPAFVMLGITVVATILGGETVASVLPVVSFGPWFCTHITFCGAVAASAYLHRKGISENGMDIITPLCKYKNWKALFVGGAFGCLSYVINDVLSSAIGIHLFKNGSWTDTVALTIVLDNMAVRFVFGKTGLFGERGPARRISQERLSFLAALGFGAALVICGVAVVLGEQGFAGDAAALYMFKSMGTFGFGISAILFILIPMGKPMECFHQILLPAATTTITIYTVCQNGILALAGGVLMGIAGAIINDILALIFNTGTDTHIDAPSFTIALLQLFNMSILPYML